jgi:hypothetical protein
MIRVSEKLKRGRKMLVELDEVIRVLKVCADDGDVYEILPCIERLKLHFGIKEGE